MRVAAIIAAGGIGTRIGGAIPKQFLDLGDGTIMLRRSIEAMAACAAVDEIVVALPQGASGGWDANMPTVHQPITFVEGGPRRQDSVANALARISDGAEVIVIHDAARPFATPDLVERAVKAAQEHGAAITAVAVTDTVKQTTGKGKDQRVIRATLPRETIFLAQTPQAFRRDVLTDAMAGAADANVTDEAMLVERAGYRVHIVDGDPRNIKVTTAEDLAAARSYVKEQGIAAATSMRIGTGYDLHRLVPDRPLILSGVRIPFEHGLHGHSDADIVCHAVTDAVLGAVSLGDIGRLFPDTSPQWRDADSVHMLQTAMDVVRNAGYAVANVDVTVIAERPKLLPYLEEMRANLARALGIDASAVSIKGKTNEGIGEVGRGEAMACHAVALLIKAS